MKNFHFNFSVRKIKDTLEQMAREQDCEVDDLDEALVQATIDEIVEEDRQHRKFIKENSE